MRLLDTEVALESRSATILKIKMKKYLFNDKSP